MSDGVSTRTLSLAELPATSGFYEQVIQVKGFSVFLFLAFWSLSVVLL